jgi:apolipoprotein N-acyltransferase
MAQIAATIASAAVYVLLFPPFGATALSWVALVPLLLALRSASVARTAALSALWGVLITAGIVVWLLPTLHGHFQQSWTLSLGLWLFVSAFSVAPFYAGALAAFAWGRSRVKPHWRPGLLVAAWIAAEFARTHIGLRSPWALLGESHFESARLRQVAELGGVYAVSAIVVLGNAAAAEVIALVSERVRGRSPAIRTPALIGVGFAAVLASALSFGQVRIGATPQAERSFEVAVIQGNVPSELRWKRAHNARVLRRYGSLTRGALREAPELDLVVWPENAIQTSPHDAVFGGPVRSLARSGTPLLMGAPGVTSGAGTIRRHNSAYLLQGVDRPVERYDKRRLLPFSESRPLGAGFGLAQRGDLDATEYTPGRAPGIFEIGSVKLGVLICMEALYPHLTREAAQLGSTLLVVLSNDSWYRGRGGAEQHLAQVVFRAIETRLPLVRAASTGISAVVTPDGSILKKLDEAEAGVLRAAIPTGARPPTAYTRFGDVFALTCLALLALPAPLGWRRS